MIVYFTGTGNSRYCAQILAGHLGDKLTDSFHFIRDGIAAELRSDRPWRYTTDVGRQEYTITAEDATAFAGKDIKQCAASASELQSLIQSLNINIQRSIV